MSVPINICQAFEAWNDAFRTFRNTPNEATAVILAQTGAAFTRMNFQSPVDSNLREWAQKLAADVENLTEARSRVLNART